MVTIASILRDGEDPSMPALRGWLANLAGSVSAAAHGFRTFSSVGSLNAYTPATGEPTYAFVADGTQFQAYRYASGAWVQDPAYALGLAEALEPQFEEVEARVSQALLSSTLIAGAASGVPIANNVNNLAADVPSFAPDIRFELLILRANTGEVILTVEGSTGPIARGNGVSYAAGELIPGNVYTLSFSVGGGRFVAFGEPRSIIMKAPVKEDIGASIDDLGGQPYGTIGAGNAVTVTPMIITSAGSSVGTDDSARQGGAPVGYAPVKVLCDEINAAWPLAGVVATPDNWSKGGTVIEQFAAQLAESAAYVAGTSRLALLVGGMNDFQIPSYNIGVTYEGTRLEAIKLIEANKAKGIKTLLCTTPHLRTTMVDYAGFYSANPTAAQVYPRAISAPVDPETEQYPPASQSKGMRDMTGSGVMSEYDVRFWHGNRMLREVARLYPNDVILLDVEWAWFRYGVEKYGVDALYDTGQVVHPNVLGHQVSYGRVLKRFAQDLAAGRLLRRSYRGDEQDRTDLAGVATSGSYDDLEDKPTLGSAAARAAEDFATAAQGGLIDGLAEALAASDAQRIAADNVLAGNIEALAAAASGEASLATVLQTQGRPGDAIARFTSTLTGPGPAGAPPSGAVVIDDGGAAVLRVVGATVTGTRERIYLDPTRKYRVRLSSRRVVDPTDPAGDTVRYAIQWLTKNQAQISQHVVADVTQMFVNGRVERSTIIAAAAGSGVDYVWPSTARYMVPFVQTYGLDGETTVEVNEWDDVTDVVSLNDGKLNRSGNQPMTGPLQMAQQRIVDLPQPQHPDDAARAGFVDSSVASASSQLRSEIKQVDRNMSRWLDEDVTLIPNSYYDTYTGQINSFADLHCYKVNVGSVVNQQFRASGRVTGGTSALATYYDVNGVVIDRQFVGQNGQTTIHDRQRLSPPAETVFIASSGLQAYPLTLERAEIILSETLDGRIGALELGAPNSLAGKKGVTVGTSVPAGIPGNNYPDMFYGLLGMIGVNEAIGASTMRFGVAENRTSSDIYGLAGMVWPNAAFALSADYADKQYIIDNWHTGARVYDLIAPGFGKPADAALSVQDQAGLMSSSWEYRIARHFGAETPYLFDIDHGRNDDPFDDIRVVPADPLDRGTFIGATNYVIGKILANNPKQRIIFSGDYDPSRLSVIEAQQILAGESQWSLPLFPAWKLLGWSQKTVMVGGTTQTLLQTYVPDGLHPHSDSSGFSNREYARLKAAWLLQNA